MNETIYKTKYIVIAGITTAKVVFSFEKAVDGMFFSVYIIPYSEGKNTQINLAKGYLKGADVTNAMTTLEILYLNFKITDI